jgi:hypothetical protein
LDVTPDLWIPLQLNANSTSHGPSLIAVGRLRPGVSLALAQADADLTAEAFRRLYPQVIGPTDTFTVAPFHDAAVQSARPSLLLLVLTSLGGGLGLIVSAIGFAFSWR